MKTEKEIKKNLENLKAKRKEFLQLLESGKITPIFTMANNNHASELDAKISELEWVLNESNSESAEMKKEETESTEAELPQHADSSNNKGNKEKDCSYFKNCRIKNKNGKCRKNCFYNPNKRTI